MLTVATTPYFDEPPEMVLAAGMSLPLTDWDRWRWHQYEIKLDRDHPTESSLRKPGLDVAIKAGADWWLQLDADEYLVNGEHLSEMLERFDGPAFPLPRLEESGGVGVCPYKLVRLPVELVIGCDHFKRPGDDRIWRYSYDRSANEQEIPQLLAGPHLVHTPSARPKDRKTVRVGELENVVEPRPRRVSALDFSLPPISLQGGTMSGEEGKYYCPGCGARYEQPGVCRGKDEAGHEPINVALASKGDVDPVDARAETNEQGEVVEQPKPKRKPSARKSSTRKKSTTTRKRTR